MCKRIGRVSAVKIVLPISSKVSDFTTHTPLSTISVFFLTRPLILHADTFPATHSRFYDNDRRISTNTNCNSRKLCGPSFPFCQSRRLRLNPLFIPSFSLSKFKRISTRGGLLDLKNSGLIESVIHASTPDGDSTVESCQQSEESSAAGVDRRSCRSGPNRRRENQRKVDGWWWLWYKIISAPEIRVLLFQLGLAVFAMAMLQPERRAPGSDPSSLPVAYRTVPYSVFLSKVNGDEVDKVEVDGVRLTFKLRQECRSGNTDCGSGISSNQEQEPMLTSMGPYHKIVYTTVRPADIKTPYDKMLKNQVEFRSPNRQSGGLFNAALITLFYSAAALAVLLNWTPVSFSSKYMTTGAGQLRSKKSRKFGSGGAQVYEQQEAITFADVAGVDEAKEELEEIVEFLRNPDRYTRVGARPPQGVLLVGRPGTGKTLLAKAVAGEADVPFISCSASEFVELYVGRGASRVRDLFAWAKKESPSIIFIDEIDAVAKCRDGKSRFMSNDEREQTLNQLLTEMDGFDSKSSVIVLAATNRSDVLDPALSRPGRFDRIVMVEAPDKLGREAILKVHVSKKKLPLGDEVDLNEIALMTTGFTGADLANLVNEAALLAGRQNKAVVQSIDFVHAVERSIAGIEKKTVKLRGSEKAVVAHHEAGHAIVGTAIANLLPGQPLVKKLSILPRIGGSLGFTYTPPNEDRYLIFIDELHGRLVTLMGGRAAEEVMYSGRASTGSLDDIRRATNIAYKAVAEYGLNQVIGPLSVSTLCGGGMNESQAAAPWDRNQGHLVDVVQNEVKTLLQSAMGAALSIVRANSDVLEGLGATLEENEKVEGEELHRWLDTVVVPTEVAAFVRGNGSVSLHTS